MTHYTKLVRDNIPDILDKKGVLYEKRIATDREYKAELLKKLVEEVHEFAEAGAVEELADVLEVVDALRALEEYAQVDSVQEVKRNERGGFSKKIILSGEKP